MKRSVAKVWIVGEKRCGPKFVSVQIFGQFVYPDNNITFKPSDLDDFLGTTFEWIIVELNNKLHIGKITPTKCTGEILDLVWDDDSPMLKMEG